MEKNTLIETWKTGATLILLNAPKNYNVQELLKDLATSQLDMLREDRPDKTKTLEENCNKEQLELVYYLNQVKEKGTL